MQLYSNQGIVEQIDLLVVDVELLHFLLVTPLIGPPATRRKRLKTRALQQELGYYHPVESMSQWPSRFERSVSRSCDSYG